MPQSIPASAWTVGSTVSPVGAAREGGAALMPGSPMCPTVSSGHEQVIITLISPQSPAKTPI